MGHAATVSEIAYWLMDEVFAPNYQNNAEAEYYAEMIFQFGAHSVEMIIDCVKPSDVHSFRWMHHIHRRMLVTFLLETDHPAAATGSDLPW
jgi:hypothetical protein